MDNWKHKSDGMKCKTCTHFVPKKILPIESAQRDTSKDLKIGRCRKHAPTLNGWPVMFLDDWCGDHKLDEEKI